MDWSKILNTETRCKALGSSSRPVKQMRQGQGSFCFWWLDDILGSPNIRIIKMDLNHTHLMLSCHFLFDQLHLSVRLSSISQNKLVPSDLFSNLILNQELIFWEKKERNRWLSEHDIKFPSLQISRLSSSSLVMTAPVNLDTIIFQCSKNISFRVLQ